MTVAVLSELILDHRAAYQAETRAVLQISTERPPVLFDYEKAAWFEEPAAAIGLNLSALMVRLTGHADGFGHVFPWRQSAWRLRYECRTQHLGHTDRDAFEGSLCQRLVYLVVPFEYSPDMAAWQLSLTPDRSMRVLEEALHWIDGNLRDEDDRLEEREKMRDHQATVTLMAHFERQHNEQREQRAWEWLVAHGYPQLPSWELERERRLAYHQLNGCPRCRVDAA
jgi:hypothetical protein